MNKVIHYNDLPRLISKLSSNKKVLVGGCFDILHLGHVRFLREAKKYGKVLVALESDATLTKHKGHLRPIHQQAERAEVLATLRTVDYVILLPAFTKHADYFQLVKDISPQVICITAGDPLMKNKQLQAKDVGAKLIIIPKIHTPSTTQLMKLLEIE